MAEEQGGTVDRQAPIIGGLDLGTDPAKTPLVTIADGARFDIRGVVTSRYGRKMLGLEFPYEGVGSTGIWNGSSGDSNYIQTLDPFISRGTRTRGVGVLYDQRIVDRPPETLSETGFGDTRYPSTKWGTTGSFIVLDLDENGLGFVDYNGGGATLFQTKANMVNSGLDVQPNTDYILEYTLITDGSGAGSTTIAITTGFAQATTQLTVASGRHQTRFTSNSSPGTFTLQFTGDRHWDLLSVSLRQAQIAINLPQRMNLVFKSNGGLWLNDTYPGASDGILSGNGSFSDMNSRAKIVTQGDEVFIVDANDKPMIMRRLPSEFQYHLRRVRYEVGRMGFTYPKTYKDRCKVSVTGVLSGGETALPTGVYRFRMALENRYGDISAPCLVSSEAAITNTASAKKVVVTAPPSPDDPGWTVKKWRIYVSFQSGAYDGTKLDTLGNEPGPFKFWRTIDYGTETTATYHGGEHKQMTDAPVMLTDRADTPKMTDFMVLNSSGYGICSVDSVYREVIDTEADGTPLRPAYDGYLGIPGVGPGAPRPVVYDPSVIRERRVDPTYLVTSAPGEPSALGTLYKFTQGDELGVGLSYIGDQVVIFTTKGIILFDPVAKSFKRSPSQIGCLSRDTIEHTEDGIRFMGTDGIPRLFNGATAQELADEVSPVFSKEDYSGHYLRFDRTYASEAHTATANRKVFMCYPVSSNPGDVPTKPLYGATVERNLLVGDMTRKGRPLWSIDKRGFDQLIWLGRESRLLAVDVNGVFYFIEEGLLDEQLSGVDTNPPFEWAPRWFGSSWINAFKSFRIEIDTKGQDVKLYCTVDDKSNIQAEYTINTTGRRIFDGYFPGYFKGLYLETRFVGATTSAGRPEIYDVQVERKPTGVF